ncbi:bifunctional proline dehydrogenase/L-glutamate gamma-semialdehyde dehydrogenase [Sulfurimonas microaerophilic]|uniref:bifunctional proline dehydrogenase/L-glutamate gamma-semialdehyde dehydrogenase n=1 Tax=Sulfurimonas microaerophilic TaxID=3058392 RepID=UPI0027149F9D|nr:bifunctional proline dehydrogenase/L-glutamate gamma-semialdehyde dehydrogenase [Sulfurimonas sp. hsl 1-7]
MDISPAIHEEVKKLARKWQERIEVSREAKEQEFHQMMLKMLDNPLNKIFLIELLDQSFRSNETKRVADQLEYIFEKYGTTDFFSEFECFLIWLFREIGIYVSSISVPLFIKYLRNDISSIVIQGEDELLRKHLQKRKAEGTRVNINVIGEIVLSEAEAQRRQEKYIKILQNKDIDYLSIKISNLFSQFVPYAHQNSVDKLSKRVEKIYEAALNNGDKFVNLDMEEYKDIEITIDVFKSLLSEERFKNLYAGIVIQNYLPDAMIYIKDLTSWAKQRVEDGGAPIKIRIVKGANQEMELTEASLRGWPAVIFATKAQSDANFKVAMNYLLDPDVAPYVHTGVASHNLFDHALAILLAKERKVEQYLTAEMLEGMSEAAYQTLKSEGVDVVLYAPTATKETFTNAIAYLVRRFDENTAENNFLRHSFGLKVDTPEWEVLLKSYDDAIELMDTLESKPYRTQDRNQEQEKKELDLKNYHFRNEADTDFVLPQNRKWAESIRDKWKNIGDNGGIDAYPVIAGVERNDQEDIHEVYDKSQYHEKKKVGSFTRATLGDMQLAVQTAKEDLDGWRELSQQQRQKILMDAAEEFRKARGDLIGIAAAEVGKVFSETDVEVSEAIDFLNFYPYSVEKLSSLEGVSVTPKGVGVVISPWNFPIAIPVGGIAASLAAGNTVILKPAEDAMLCGYMLCQCFWRAGVSKNTLQYLPARGSEVGEYVIPDKNVDYVIFTGGEESAYKIIESRPDIALSAETGGKDATIVTAMADRDQALKNVLVSAFHNSGQKCSATSLLVLEKELYDDQTYKQAIKEAVESLETGSVWDFKNRIGTLSNLPSGNLKKSLSYLDDTEEWLVKPEYADEQNPYMLKPSVRWGTKKGDFCHMNELFGPVLSVMRAENLKDAVDIVNSTNYGLTSGLETLDDREITFWKENIIAGNLYINRGTTGAIVLRQPFGGMRKSAIGSGKKAGGFNYTSQFMNIECINISSDEQESSEFIEEIRKFFTQKKNFQAEIQKALEYAAGFSYWYRREFLPDHDYVNIRGESNVSRYIAVHSVLLRLEDNDDFTEVLASIFAIKMVDIKLHISLPKLSQKPEYKWLESSLAVILGKDDTVVREDEVMLIDSISKYERIRFLSKENISQNIFNAVATEAKYIASAPFVAHGRIELMHYFVEQSVTHSYHRYGNLGVHGLHLYKKQIQD